MHMKNTLVGGIFSVALMAAFLTGCSSSPEENVTDACAALKSYETSLSNFQTTVNSESTVGEIRAAYDDVEKSHAAYAAASAEVGQDRLKDLNEAQSAFDKAVEDLPDDATVPQSVDSLKDEAKAVETARANLANELTC